MAPPRKTVKDFEAEAVRSGSCLVHPSPNAPRKVYILRHGNLSTKQYVCHKCDVIGCLTNRHHFLGTARDNVLDSVKKGRHSCFRKGGARFTGRHDSKTRMKISDASRKMWETRSKEELFGRVS